MRIITLALLLLPSTVLADPSCEEVYWGELIEEGVITDYGLLPVDAPKQDGGYVAVRGADQENPDALRICPETYKVLRTPSLAFVQGEELAEIPDSWNSNSAYYDALVVHDPDDVGSGSVTILWDAGDTMVPMRTVFLIGRVGGRDEMIPVAPFDEIEALWRQGGDGLVFIHAQAGPTVEMKHMRWDGH